MGVRFTDESRCRLRHREIALRRAAVQSSLFQRSAARLGEGTARKSALAATGEHGRRIAVGVYAEVAGDQGGLVGWLDGTGGGTVDRRRRRGMLGLMGISSWTEGRWRRSAWLF